MRWQVGDMATVRSGKYAGRHGRVSKVFSEGANVVAGAVVLDFSGGRKSVFLPDELMTDYEVQKWGLPTKESDDAQS